MKKKKGTVLCAMSGGVDSSVAAALLKDQGYDVVGVFMKFQSSLINKCCSAEAQADARRVAAQLKIPFYVLDFRKEFKKRVIDYFIEGYQKGETPNPCVQCNKWIKFPLPLKKAKELGADYVATGHYVRLKCKMQNEKCKRWELATAKDKNKDQSYFLWALDRKNLDKILFPIGDYTKKEIRKMAKKFKLSVSEKKESQEVCFVNTDIKDFLKQHIPSNDLTRKGDIVTTDGEKVGEHKGLKSFTIGQRKGIEVGGIGPYYVAKKDFKKNTLIVAKAKESSELDSKEMFVKDINWLIEAPKLPLKCKIKVRYMTLAASGTVSPLDSASLGLSSGRRRGKQYKVVFTKPQRAITPGQSAVFYLRDRVLGGGIII